MGAHPSVFRMADRQRAALAAARIKKDQANVGLHVVPTEFDRTLAAFRRNTALAVLEEVLDDEEHPQHKDLEAIVELNWPGGAA